MSEKVTIRIACFNYGYDSETERWQEAYRHDEIEVDNVDFERGIEQGAFVEHFGAETDAPEDDIDDLSNPLVGLSVEDIAIWIEQSKPTISDLVAYVGDDKQLASDVLEAEGLATGGEPRKGLVDALTDDE